DLAVHRQPHDQTTAEALYPLQAMARAVRSRTEMVETFVEGARRARARAIRRRSRQARRRDARRLCPVLRLRARNRDAAQGMRHAALVRGQMAECSRSARPDR